MRKDLADRDGALLILDLHADSGVPPIRLLRKGGELLGREQFAVRVVELLHDTTGCLFVQRRFAHGIDESLGDDIQHLIEHLRAVGRLTILNEEASGNNRKDEECQQGGATSHEDLSRV